MNKKDSISIYQSITKISSDLIEEASTPMEKNKNNIVRPRFKKLVAAVVAAALVITLSVTAVATKGFSNLAELLSPAFSPESSLDVEAIERMGTPIGKSATDNGITVTLDAVIRDRNNITAVFSVNGAKAKELLFDEGELKIGSFSQKHTSGSCSLHPTDKDSLSFTAGWESREEIPSGQAEITLGGLTLYPDRPILQRHVEGTWTFDFNVSFEDMTRVLPAGQTVTVLDMPITIDRISLSPMALNFDYTVDAGEHFSQFADVNDTEWQETSKGVFDLAVVITRKDGTRIVSGSLYEEGVEGMKGFKSRTVNTRFGNRVLYCEDSCELGTVLSFDDIQSITIEGVEIPLK